MPHQPTIMRLAAFSLAAGLLLCIGCQSDVPTYEGREVVIQYDRDDRFVDGEWIRIDDHRFRHVRSRRRADSVNFSLPASEIVFDSTASRAFTKEIGPQSTALYLAQYIDVLNASSAEPKYVIQDRPLVTLEGRLTLTTPSASPITVQTSEGYDATVRTKP